MLGSTAAAALIGALPVQVRAFAQDAGDPLAARRYGGWGFDLAGMDRAVGPGEDFYLFANGRCLRYTEIPADRSSVGMFYVLRELSDDRVRAIVERAATAPGNEREARVGAYYRSLMDEARIAALDDAPIRPKLAAIRAMGDRDALARLQGESLQGGGGTLFGFGVGPDDREPSRNVVFGGHATLGLPEREYYLADGFAEHRTRYRAYVARMLGLAGWPEPASAADRVVAFETEVARLHWPINDRQDAIRTYNPTTFSALAQNAPDFPWRAFLAGAGLESWRGKVVIAEHSAIAPIAAAFARAPIETLQAWAAFRLVDQAAPYLSPRFEDAHFDFRLRFLEGQPQPRPRWKRAVAEVNEALAHEVGRTYADLYFTPATKARMDELVANVVAGMRRRIDGLAWMGTETRARALDKLAKFRPNIGYPPRYRDFAGLALDPQDAFGNVARAQHFTWRWSLGKLDRPVDRTEWSDTPQTVNAYYRSTYNDITFPAGILQPPFFDPDADPAINYGAIGAVIGHEISHGFDDQGRRYDGDGVLRDWWTATDAARFEAEADKLVAQFDRFEPLPGARVNGRLTLGDNIGDLAGLTMALDAYRASLGGRPAPVIDGFTGEQRFFLGWAQAWRAKYRDPLLRQLLATDGHAPPHTRVNGPVRNIDAWYEAFGIGEGHALYLPPDQRVRLW